MPSNTHVIKLMVPAQIAETIALPGDLPGAYEVEPAHKLHITLAFLGKGLSYATTVKARTQIARTCRRYGAITIPVGPFGRFCFPKREVVWADVGASRVLAELRQELVCMLALEDVPVDATYDRDGWTPHITVARVRPGAAATERHEIGTVVTFPEITYKAGHESTSYPLLGDRA